MKILIPIIMFILVLCIYFSFSKNSNITSDNKIKYISSLEYGDKMESKLKTVLSKVKGAGNVEVMITFESAPELKIATETDERKNTTTNSQGTVTNVTIVEKPIIVTQNGKDSPLILTEILPIIKGVLIVSKGANDTSVKLQLLEAVQSLLKIPGSNIQILQGI